MSDNTSNDTKYGQDGVANDPCALRQSSDSDQTAFPMLEDDLQGDGSCFTLDDAANFRDGHGDPEDIKESMLASRYFETLTQSECRHTMLPKMLLIGMNFSDELWLVQNPRRHLRLSSRHIIR